MDISIIDYIGKVNNGIAILMSWVLFEEYHEFIFWFNKENEYKIYTNYELNEKLNIENIHDWILIEDFIIHVNSILPYKNDIYKEFDL